MKTCSKCGFVGEDDLFIKGQCKECRNTYLRQWKANKKDVIKEKGREYYLANADKLKKNAAAYDKTLRGKLAQYKCSAKKRGLSFDLDIESFKTFWQKPCHWCGDEITTIGVDRIDNTIGYTLENCAPCCSMCNYIKQEYQPQEWLAHMLKILKLQGLVA